MPPDPIGREHSFAHLPRDVVTLNSEETKPVAPAIINFLTECCAIMIF